MSVETTLKRFGPLLVRASRLRRPAFDEWWVSVRGQQPTTPTDQALAALPDVAGWLRAEGIAPFQDKLYASPGALAPLTHAWQSAWSAPALPAPGTSAVASEGFEGVGLHGVQLWGMVVRAGGGVQAAPGRHAPGARRFEGPGYRLVHLPAVHGAPTDDAQGRPGQNSGCDTVTRQAQQMFERASAALHDQGMAYPQVLRTWIYFERLLDWYGEFNRVRSAHHLRCGIDPQAPPASTGIQGQWGAALGAQPAPGRPTGEVACFMDVLAAQVDEGAADLPLPVRFEPLRHSARQQGAPEYGSAFSRGMVLQAQGRKTILVSGTASIDAQGRSTHPGDHEAQCVQTLMAVASLLETEGAGLEHLRLTTVFCRDALALQAYQRVCRLLRLPDLPAVLVRADVCRPELLIEIEAVATL